MLRVSIGVESQYLQPFLRLIFCLQSLYIAIPPHEWTKSILEKIDRHHRELKAAYDDGWFAGDSKDNFGDEIEKSIKKQELVSTQYTAA